MKFRQQVGFTLIEMAVTVVIILILASVAMPSFSTFLGNIQVRSAAESVLQGLQLARAEAIRRNERVRFVVASNTGWTVSTDAGTNIQTKQPREGAPNTTLTFNPGTGTRVTFNSFGRVTTNADGSGALTQIAFTTAGATASRRITISSGGQLHLCDPDIDTPGEPGLC